MNADGSYTYDPNGKFGGLGAGNTASDSFTYQASDGSLTDTATVKITITGENEPPDAVNDTGATDANKILTAPAPGVLGNDVDPDVFDTLTVSKVNGSTTDVGKSITLASGAVDRQRQRQLHLQSQRQVRQLRRGQACHGFLHLYRRRQLG